MEQTFLNEIHEYYNYLLRVHQGQLDRLDKIAHFSRCRLKCKVSESGSPFFSFKQPGDTKYRYLGGRTNEKVQFISEARYLKQSLKVVDRDISLLRGVLENYDSISFNNILNGIPKSYRYINTRPALLLNEKAKAWKAEKESYKARFKPYKPDELIHTTVDGTKVRSKSEMAIYNYLFNNGYTFVYELPIYTQNRLFVPDFTILSEIDYRTEIKIEHQGMYGVESYRDASDARQYDYWRCGFLPSKDVYFTFDDHKGGFDISPILDILKCRIRPDNIVNCRNIYDDK